MGDSEAGWVCRGGASEAGWVCGCVSGCCEGWAGVWVCEAENTRPGGAHTHTAGKRSSPLSLVSRFLCVLRALKCMFIDNFEVTLKHIILH